MSSPASVIAGSPVPPAESPVVGAGGTPDNVPATEPPQSAAASPDQAAEPPVARPLDMSEEPPVEAAPAVTAADPVTVPAVASSTPVAPDVAETTALGTATPAPLDAAMAASDCASVNPYSPPVGGGAPPAAAEGSAESSRAGIVLPSTASAVAAPLVPETPIMPEVPSDQAPPADSPIANGGMEAAPAPTGGAEVPVAAEPSSPGATETTAEPTATAGATETTGTTNGGRSPSDIKKEKKPKNDKKDKADKKEKKKKEAAGGDAPHDGGSTPNASDLPKSRKKKLRKAAAFGPLDGAKDKDNSGTTNQSDASRPFAEGDIFHLAGVPHAAVHMGDNRLSVNVLSMGPLTPDPNNVHPFVRVWIIEGSTGESLSLAPGGEAACAFTHPFDLRDHESVSPKWDEHVSLELVEPLADATMPMLMVELLDFGPTNIRGEAKDKYLGSGLMPIAWGFVNLTDPYGRSNLSRNISVQLFNAPERRGIFSSIAATARSIVMPAPQTAASAGWAAPQSGEMQRVPPVFRHLLNPLNRNDVYDAGLTVQISLVDDTFDSPIPPGLSFKDQILMEQLLSVMGRAVGGLGNHKSVVLSGSYDAHGRRGNRAENERRRIARLLQSDFTRGTAERCLPPKEQLHTIRCDAKVSALAFSPDGEILAAALTSDMAASVRLYHVTSPRCDVVGDLRGNVGYVHKVLFSPDGRMLLATSADHTVRVWDVSTLPAHDIAPMHVLGHAGHVYSAIFLQRSVVSGGIDGHLHLWSLDDGALRSRTPNTFNACFRAITTSRDSLVATTSGATGGRSPSMSRRLAAASSTADGTERAKFWTLDSVGTFSAWSAFEFEAQNATFNKLGQRTRLQVQGATRLHLEGRTAVLYVPSDAPAFVVVNTRTMTVLGTVGIGSVPHHLRHAVPRLPTTLLPDGMTAVFALSSSSVVAVDLTLGELLTAREGVSFTPDKRFPTHMSWSPGRHMAAMSSVDTEGPVGCTINIVGRPRAAGEECYVHDPQSTNVLRHLYGGQVSIRSAHARGPLGPTGGGSLERSVNTPRRRPATKSNLPTAEPMPAPSGDLRHRFNQIISYWRGRATSHGAAPRDLAEGTATGTAVTVPDAAQEVAATSNRGPTEL